MAADGRARSTRYWIVSGIAASVLAAGCAGKPSGRLTLPPPTTPSDPSLNVPTTETSAESTTTTAPTTTIAMSQIGPGALPAGSRTLSSGSSGDDVLAVEQRLADLKFEPGKVDGKYDSWTGQAVMSFQKQVGLPRSTSANRATIERLMVSGYGPPMVADGAPTRVEVDLSRQVMQYWWNGALVRVIGVSTGHGKRYCDTTKDGRKVCGTAVTPTGRFTMQRHQAGKRESDLGILYDPVYFHHGYAVHGSPSVPSTPASHGCVRIPMWLSRWFYDNVKLGTQMVIIKDGAPPVPTVGTALPPPDEPTTTTTAAPATTAAPTTAASSTTKASTTTSTTDGGVWGG